MSLYDFPQFSLTTQRRNRMNSKTRTQVFVSAFVFSILGSVIGGAVFGGFIYWKLNQDLADLRASLPNQRIAVNGQGYIPQSTQEERIIGAVKETSPAVVSIILTKDEPVFERVYMDPFEEFFGGPSPFQVPELRQNGTEKREVGGGSGFFVSADGLIATNKHVVLRDDVEYTVFTKDGKSYPAEVLARDPLQDFAIIKIEPGDTTFPFVELGNSTDLQIGQTVVAIGNALGEFRNTVSTGVISGLGRTITASDGGDFVETIEDVIQTDAAINRGNSGGPLLNLAGQVIGVNTATVLEAQSIGFAIPVDKVKRALYQVQELGKIVYPFLGIQYELITEAVQEERGLSVSTGAFILDVVEGSAADTAGLQKDDILLEFGDQKITPQNSLAKIMQQYSEKNEKPAFNPGDEVILRVLRDGEEIKLTAVLGEREED